ncbi:chromosome-associated kinesin KIF4-like isoform X1 [Lethenteron reissneri]|uniref:chromosome-associated kinesin KIF4-like isoform X1 n=1 Tax=Lethenteron reissneri TaxID=7753 RepID=UPI002AB5E9B2|nr:chromosome-associated kinesin KIF4-like isoform X1 [Lethenteron reissneri]
MESIATRVKTWLAHELEVLVSTEDARRHLADLLEDRAVLASELTRLRELQQQQQQQQRNEQPPSKIRRRTLLVSELEEALRPSEELGPQIASLETEIGLRSAQIADLQQKLLGVSSEERGRPRWDAIATIMEAKCALRWLLDQLVAARVCAARASEDLREAREGRDDAMRSAAEERDAAREERERFNIKIGRLEVEHQDKVLLLLNQLQRSSRPQNEDQQRESLQKEQREQMALLREENESLRQKSSTTKPRRPSARTRPLVTLSQIISESETSDSKGPSASAAAVEDADWRPQRSGGAVPGVAARPALQRRSKNTTASRCRCNGRCATRQCGCQRAGVECSAQRCGCEHDKCTNRSHAKSSTAKPRRPSARTRALVTLSQIISESETSDSEGPSASAAAVEDADWRPKPSGGAVPGVAARPALQRRSKNATASRCRCTGRCATRQCGCQRAGVKCSEQRCGCEHDKCTNRSHAGVEVSSEKLETSSSLSDDSSSFKRDDSFKRDEPPFATKWQ